MKDVGNINMSFVHYNMKSLLIRSISTGLMMTGGIELMLRRSSSR
jgi:hypothetical protein